MNQPRKSHCQHPGELGVQRRRQVPAEHSASIVGAIRETMTRQHAEYYRSLDYLPLGALDAEGRPWATILCQPQISAPTSEMLHISARVNPRDPFVQAVCAAGLDPKPFAGVAIDFTNRRRVKLAGTVARATLDAAGRLTLALRTDEHMGNCPKYITVRQLRHRQRTPETTVQTGRLSPEAQRVLKEASTAFVATRHVDQDPRESDMGLNHRGGPRGFIRYLEGEQGAQLVLPDYSGNRFYQSLGNVETDPVMGVTVPDFKSGELLQVSGRARNVFDADAARIMPGATLLTLISVEQASLTRGALDLELIGEEQPSPYNPRLRVLAAEMDRPLETLADPAGLDGRTVFVCGPEPFMADVKSWLDGKLEPERLRFESFAF